MNDRIAEPPARIPATLKDLARELGVSTSTVSRALSGHPAISDETRRAVQQAASNLGYRLPTLGRRPRKSTTRTVGVVMGAMHNRFMTLLLEYIHHALLEQGYHVALIIDSLNEAEDMSVFRPLIDGYLDGLIFTTATLDSPVIKELYRRGVPLVLAVRSVRDVGVDIVEIDNVHAGFEAGRHLYELGHRHVGLAMGPLNTSTSRDRVCGALRFFSDAGISQDQTPVMWGQYTHESGYSSAMELLSRHTSLTAIIAGNDTVALGVLEAAHRLGLPVPGRLSVIGFDDIPIAASPLVSLSTVRQPVEAMARTCARRLVERMRKGALAGPPTRDVLPIHLVQRGSTGLAAMTSSAA
jgi:LacI family transcriptional regulator